MRVIDDHIAHATCSDGIAANWFSNLLACRGSASSPHHPHDRYCAPMSWKPSAVSMRGGAVGYRQNTISAPSVSSTRTARACEYRSLRR